MADVDELTEFLDGAEVDPAVFALRPDYRVLLVAVDGLHRSPRDDATRDERSSHSGASDQGSDRLLRAAEAAAGQLLAEAAVEDLPHIAAWRDAYRGFGAKPQRTRNSLEALTRRAAAGLPRVNRLTDAYNAVSVLHQVPVGGEDLSRYTGSPRLLRSTGTEPFDTAADGNAFVEYPQAGEVVWCDDAGATCRRWNWRQARRTQLTLQTTSALFILDALEPMTDQALVAAADELIGHLQHPGSDLQVATRLLGNNQR